jgi:hypothetical protein
MAPATSSRPLVEDEPRSASAAPDAYQAI